jgi:hypothetical protein
MAAPKPQNAPLPEHAALADELGALEKEMAPFAQKLARIELLKRTLRAACPALPGSPWTVTGARFVALLGPCAMQRRINVADLVKYIGSAMFAKFATCTLADLERNVKPEVAAGVVMAGPTGPRPLKTFEKGAA